MDSGPADLLVRCLSARVEPAFSDQVGRYSSNDWHEVVDMAAHHGLVPLLFKRLKESDARACVPADAWKGLRSAYFASADRNARLYRELRTVLRCLRSSGIPVIVLKGAYLAEAVYGDVALRPICDVDLMVPRAELPRAQAVLLDMGCVQQESEDIESYCRREPHLPAIFMRDLVIELHWTIASPTGPFRVDTAGLWDRAHPATIAGVGFLALSPEDLLLHLCLHFGHEHHLARLRFLYDIAETIHRFRGEMGWAQVVHSAREWGAARYVGLTLHLARSMLGTGVPDDVLEQLVPGGLGQRLLEAARDCALTQTGYDPRVPRPFFDEWRAESLGDKARLPWKRVFLSRDEMAARYPASRDSRHFYFYYALRLRDVIRNFGGPHALSRGRLMVRSRGRGREVLLVNWLKSGKP